MENKKVVPTLRKRVDTDASNHPKTTDNHCTINLTQSGLLRQEPYRSIYALMGLGAGNAIHKQHLMKLTDLSDRVLRKHIESIRRDGTVIVSDVSGYYLPASIEEVTAYRKQEERRAKSTLYTLKAARAMEKTMTAGQEI